MKWKTGFYYIARGANVPIVLGFFNYAKKAAGFGPVYFPTGDIAADMKQIRSYYAGIKGKYRVEEESFFMNPTYMGKPNYK